MTNLKNQFQLKFAVLAILFSLALIVHSEEGYSQGVGISNTAIIPDASAVLEMRSTNQGVLVPRMTTLQRNGILTPAAGLMIYNTDTGTFNFYQGSWKEITSGAVTNVTASGNIISTGGVTPNLAFTGSLPVVNGGTGLTAGNSGGILGYTAAGTLASSPALTSKALIIGGGAGVTPSSLPLGTANQMLGMNAAGTDHEYKTINAGSGIAITNSPASVTIENAIPLNEFSDMLSTQTTQALNTFALVPGMTFNPLLAGEYMVWFSSSITNSAKNVVSISLFYNDIQVVNSQRSVDIPAPSSPATCSTQALIKVPSVAVGKNIELRWKVDGGTGTMTQRTLTIMKVK